MTPYFAGRNIGLFDGIGVIILSVKSTCILLQTSAFPRF